MVSPLNGQSMARGMGRGIGRGIHKTRPSDLGNTHGPALGFSPRLFPFDIWIHIRQTVPVRFWEND
jgi:hypothetical protein